MKNEDVENEYLKRRFHQRENGLFHPTYDTELRFYDIVKSGDLEMLEKTMCSDELNLPERGILSKDSLRNLKYHLIVSVAMISRFCIEGGLDEKVSYGLSDVYINRIDVAVSETELQTIHREMAFDFAKRMKHTKSGQELSVYCVKAMDYISDHLHEAIQVEDVAQFVNLDKTYFGKLFHKETGQTASAYIRSQKIQAAQDMLIYTDYTCAEIAQYLSFSSQSHFADLFKKQNHMTPSEYRSKYYRKHWNKDQLL